MRTTISVIIPAKNEEDNLKIIVPLLFRNYRKEILEIIVVNDGSIDQTKAVLKNLSKKYSKLKVSERNGKTGVGLAIRDGIKLVSKKSSHILFMDCDFIANIPDIKKMIIKVKKYDGVTGSRFLEKGNLVNYPFPKLVCNRIYNLLAKLLLNVSQKDLTNNFKLYSKNVVDKIFPLLKRSDFAINAEIGYYPVILDYSIGEVPVIWKERDKNMGLSKFKIFRVGPSYIKVLMRLLKIKHLSK